MPLFFMVKEEKDRIRAYIKIEKRKYSKTELQVKSISVLKQIEKDKCFLNSKIVLAYWSMPDEVSTHEFIEKWAKTKAFLLPVIHGNILKLKYFNGISTMKAEPKFGILEPVGEEFTDFEKIEFIIVPGVAFDLHNNRLGHGKGYYDILLPNTPKAKKVGICFDFQLVDEVPMDEFDVKMDLVISET